MADRMLHSLMANYAPSSFQLPLSMLFIIGGRGNHPGSLRAIHWEDWDCCGHNLSNMDTEIRRKIYHYWSLMYSSK